MTIELVSEDLQSRKLRENLLGDKDIREIVGVKKENEGNLFSAIFGSIIDGLFDVGGWVVQGVFGALDVTFNAALGFILGVGSALATLNWNAPDEEINEKIENINNSSIQRFGQLLGNLSGWVTCGLLPAGGIMTVNQLAGLYVGVQVGAEALDDLIDQLADTIKLVVRNEAQKMVYHTFKNSRKAIKKWNEDIPSASWERKALDYFFKGESKEAIEQWGNPQKDPWSVSGSIERKKNEKSNKNTKQFWDEFWDEAGETCIEALYIVANSLDNFVLQQKMIADEVNGEQVIVQVQPNREVEEEIFTLAGGDNHIRSQLPAIMTNYQMIENRDVGQWVGAPVAEAVKTSPNELTLRILLYSNKTPPVRNSEQQASITLPDVKRSALDFDKIKKAVGGKNGYMYGRFRGKARLDNGRTLTCYADSANNAEERLEALAELIEPEILSMTVTEELKTGARANGKPLEKKPIKIYPFSIYVENKQKILNQSTDEKGFQTLDGTYRRKWNRLQIWQDDKPSDFDSVIQELLKTEGQDD